MLGRLVLACALPEIRTARRFVVEIISDMAVDQFSVEVVVAELCTNAVVHGRSAFAVEVCEVSGRLRIGVGDDNPRHPVAQRTLPVEALSGRGISVVEALSSRWGVDSSGARGKVVWAEFELGAS